MKRMLIVVCCLLLAFAAYAGNSAVIGSHGAMKGAPALTSSGPMTVDVLKAKIEKMEARGEDVSALLAQLETFRTHVGGGSRLDAVGDNCSDPILVGIPSALPYTHSYTTQNAVNDYSSTCLGSYDSGPDVIYRLDVTAATNVTMTVTPVGTYQYAGMALDVACPPGSSCLTYKSASNAAISITNYDLAAGTYYLMVDNYAPGPDYITYTLTIVANAATGRCCYPDPDACHPRCVDGVTNTACTALGGTYTSGATCQGYSCPTPIPGDVCCNAFSLLVPGVQSGTTVGFTNNYDWACTSSGTAPDVVYVYTPQADQAVTFDMCGSTLDTKMYIYQDVCSGTPIACNDDYGTGCGPSGWQSKLDCVPLLGGHTYYVIVDGYGSGSGAYILVTTVCETIDCETLVNCGTPVEAEPNEVCPPPVAQPMIGCPGMGCDNVIPVVYGTLCPTTDVDWWAVCIPPMSAMTLTPFEGPNCDMTPVTFSCGLYQGDCITVIADPFTGAIILTWPGATPYMAYLKLYSPNPNPVTYKLTATCCPLANPCDEANLIVIPCGNPGPIWHYNATVNTCNLCILPIYDCVFGDGCAIGSCYTAGPMKVFMMHTWQNASDINITITGGDLQLFVFTDCADPQGSCVASADNFYPYTGGEQLTHLALPAGIYYIGVDYYGGDCGDITLDITGDVQLPVTMGDVSVTPLDHAALVKWDTRSETSLDKWLVKRDGTTIYTVTANNGSSGHHYSFTDNGAVNGRTYSYDLVVKASDGTETVVKTLSATPTIGATVVDAYALHQNYPNPFNPTTDILYDLKDASLVTLKVYNLMGQEVATLVNGNMTQGRHVVSFDGTNLTSGLYVCKMTAGSFTAEMKMLLMK